MKLMPPLKKYIIHFAKVIWQFWENLAVFKNQNLSETKIHVYCDSILHILILDKIDRNCLKPAIVII